MGSSAFGDESPPSTATASTDLRQRQLALHPITALAHHHSQAWNDAETSPQWGCQTKKATPSPWELSEPGRTQGNRAQIKAPAYLGKVRPVRNSREQKCDWAERADRGATE